MQNDTVEFRPWPKIPRGKAISASVTEKMDGTNACIVVRDGQVVGCQSRNKMITVNDDNMGFANWVADYTHLLVNLGDGYHYGEWCGPGIQKNPHNLSTKQFFLFDAHRWNGITLERCPPSPCLVARRLYSGPVEHLDTAKVMARLWEEADGHYTPEGIIVRYLGADFMFKVTFKSTDGKWSI